MSGLPANPIAKKDSPSHDDTGTAQITTSDKEITSPQDADEEPPSERPANLGAKYSIFTTVEKRGIVLAAAAGAFFSPLSAQIYFPALDALSRDLHISVTEVNLTVTTYMVRCCPFIPILLFGSLQSVSRSFKPLPPCLLARWPTLLADAQLISSVSSYILPPVLAVLWPQTMALSLPSEPCNPPAPVLPSLCAKPSCPMSLPRPSAVRTSASPPYPSFWLLQLGQSSGA